MRTSSVLRGGDYNFTYLPIHAPILNVSWHYLVGYCRENFLTVSTIFVPVFENVGGPQILRIDFKMQPTASTIEQVPYRKTGTLRIKIH